MLRVDCLIFQTFYPLFFYFAMTTEELTQAVIEDRYKTAKQIAEEKFGEENVEFKIKDISRSSSVSEYYSKIGPNQDAIYFIIHLPQKTVVCNETGQSHEIKDVYCRVHMRLSGTFIITTARATYTMSEIISSYTHSHVSGISECYSVWKTTCLGLHSPLKTMSEQGIRDDLDWINLFNEIDRFYEVESLIGIPYTRIENISRYRNDRHPNEYYIYTKINKMAELDESYKDFVYFMAKDILETSNALSISGGSVILNETTYNFKVRVTNALIKYIKILGLEEKQFESILEKNFKDKDGKYTPISNRANVNLSPQYLFTFKGNPINRIIIPDNNEDEVILMPNFEFISYVYVKLLIMFNYERYGSSTETVKIIL